MCAFVNLLQIAVGCLAMSVLLMKLTSGRSVGFLIMLVNGGVLIASLIAVPTLWIMYGVAHTLSPFLPEPAVGAYGAVCVGFLHGCVTNIYDEEVSHSVGKTIERLVLRR